MSEGPQRRDALCAALWAILAIHSVRGGRPVPDASVVSGFVKHFEFGGASSSFERGVAGLWRAITGVPNDWASLDDPDEDDDRDDSDSDDDDYGAAGVVMQHGF